MRLGQYEQKKLVEALYWIRLKPKRIEAIAITGTK
jgi:hypothetical protein